jgi:hypothetical protein
LIDADICMWLGSHYEKAQKSSFILGKCAPSEATKATQLI